MIYIHLSRVKQINSLHSTTIHPCIHLQSILVFNSSFRIKTEDLKMLKLNRTNEPVLKHWVKKVENLPLPQKFMKFPSTSKRLFHSTAGRVKRDEQSVSRHTSSCETGLCWVCWHETMAGVLLSVRDLCSSFRGISGLRISSAFVIYQEECVMRWLCTFFIWAPTMQWVEWTWAGGSEADGLCQQRQTQLWFNMPRPLLQHTINYFQNSVLDRHVCVR